MDADYSRYIDDKLAGAPVSHRLAIAQQRGAVSGWHISNYKGNGCYRPVG